MSNQTVNPTPVAIYAVFGWNDNAEQFTRRVATVTEAISLARRYFYAKSTVALSITELNSETGQGTSLFNKTTGDASGILYSAVTA